MPIALDSATSGMNAFQQMMDVIGNNISNVDTVGFKSSSTTFENVLSQTLSGGSASQASSNGIGGTNPMQIGLGTQIGSITQNFGEGSLQDTGIPSDLAIDGTGFFVVSASPNASTPTYLTRAGQFSVDAGGYLVDPNGNYLLASNSSTPSAPTEGIQIPQGSTYTVSPSGEITVTTPSTTSGGTPTTQNYYLMLANVTNPQGLTSAGDNLYNTPIGTSSPATSTGVVYGQGSTAGFGSIQQGVLEGSNVNLTNEMSNMIVAQTGYESNSKVINTENQMDQFMLQQV